MKKQTSIAIVNDISGFGRCSLTVSLPILSAMKIQCGVVPTSILSNHTEYPEYTMLDFTPYMRDYLSVWKKLDFQFDGIYTGFLGSKGQIEILFEMFKHFQFAQTIVDPVMGDHGVIYTSYTNKMCHAMKKLVGRATLTTPNITELCILTNTTYKEHFTKPELAMMCEKLSATGVKQIIVTGIEKEDLIGNGLYENGTFEIFYDKKILPLRPGTGDVFASIIAGCSLHNIPLQRAIKEASTFIRTCLETATELNTPLNDGIPFEEHLHLLCSNEITRS